MQGKQADAGTNIENDIVRIEFRKKIIEKWPFIAILRDAMLFGRAKSLKNQRPATDFQPDFGWRHSETI